MSQCKDDVLGDEGQPSAEMPSAVPLAEVACWGLWRSQVFGHKAKMMVALPSLQRSAVWKPVQVETLWDSMFRGFPIGSLMVAPFDETKGYADYKHAQCGQNGPQPTHHLLDGQQRVTAISLGFLDLWKMNQGEADEHTQALWLDLAAPERNTEGDRDFLFRVVTRAHPWGFRGPACGRLEARQVREAVEAFRGFRGDLQGKRPAKFPLRLVWPWDAAAPVPVAFVLQAAQEGGVEFLLEKMKTLWSDNQRQHELPEAFQNVVKALDGTDPTLRKRLEDILKRAGRLVDGSYKVSLLYFDPKEQAAVEANSSADAKVDPLMTMFERLNRGGTRLEEEELSYSILKSDWPKAHEVVEKMERRLVTPARFVVTVARLRLAEVQGRKTPDPEPATTLRIPQAPDVARFRRMVMGKDKEAGSEFKELLHTMEKKDDGQPPLPIRVFGALFDLMTNEDLAFTLPPFMAAQLARQAPDVTFFVLRWIWRMLEAGQEPSKTSEEAQRGVLGFLTAIAWFSGTKDKYCIEPLWSDLQRCQGNDLPKFFTAPRLKNTLVPRDGKIRLIPLPPPEVLKKTLDRILDGLGQQNHSIWNKKHSEDGYQLGRDDKDDKTYKWWEAAVGGGTAATSVEQAWSSFINCLWERRELVLYAQRKWIRKWFPDYDPTVPDLMEDTARPWDVDHILPRCYVRKWGIPHLVRDWAKSIGNLRAWPMEANRKSGAAPPREKLDEPSETEKSPYNLKEHKDLLEASFIEDDYEYWKDSTPEPSGNGRGILGNNFVKAAASRMCRLYKEWYETLGIGALMGGEGG